MRPVDQTRVGRPEGNCLAACVASLLELPIEAVELKGGDDEWFQSLSDFFRPHGFWPVCFRLDGEWRPSGLYILAGKSPRGEFLHAVVAQGDEVFHDPHP